MPKKPSTDAQGKPLKRSSSLFARVKKGLRSKEGSPKIGRKAKPTPVDLEEADPPEADWVAGDVPNFDDLQMKASEMDQLQNIPDDQLEATINASLQAWNTDNRSSPPATPPLPEPEIASPTPTPSPVEVLDEEDNWEEDEKHREPLSDADSDEGPPPPLPPRPTAPPGHTTDLWDEDVDDITPFTYISVMERFFSLSAHVAAVDDAEC
eukprot:m.118773 g.118773  ORF g.118773 m.118773 type:complete len:209 (+) comp28696_c0_seq1:185-811(+)